MQDEEFKEDFVDHHSEVADRDPRIRAEEIRLIKIYRPLRALIQMYLLQFETEVEKSYFYLKQSNNGMTLRDAFNHADQDGSGRLNRHEFEAFYSLLGQRLYTSRDIYARFDINEHFYNNYYAGCNAYEPSAQGVSFEEF